MAVSPPRLPFHGTSACSVSFSVNNWGGIGPITTLYQPETSGGFQVLSDPIVAQFEPATPAMPESVALAWLDKRVTEITELAWT